MHLCYQHGTLRRTRHKLYAPVTSEFLPVSVTSVATLIPSHPYAKTTFWALRTLCFEKRRWWGNLCFNKQLHAIADYGLLRSCLYFLAKQSNHCISLLNAGRVHPQKWSKWTFDMQLCMAIHGEHLPSRVSNRNDDNMTALECSSLSYQPQLELSVLSVRG